MAARASAENSGLSPQVRGTPYTTPQIVSGHRFIPAGAGNTPRPFHRLTPATVYPRRCGEHGGGMSGVNKVIWFIPAGAGNTGSRGPGNRIGSVYPRRCGEHSVRSATSTSMAGLSPQVRGTQSPTHWRRSGSRFIPAGAGNTPTSVDLSRRIAVYPRRCGEHSKCRWLFLLKKIQVEKSTNHLDQ